MSCARKCLSRTFVPLAILVCVGCGVLTLNQFNAEEVITKSFKTPSAPRIIVETINGAIDVLASEQGQVKAKVTKRASGGSQEDAEEGLQDIEVAMIQEGETIHITAKVVQPKLLNNRGAKVELEIPDNSVLDLHTSNGKISSAGLTGDVTAETANGAIDVKGSRGKLHLTTTNGGIQTEGGKGKVDLRTSNGRIEIKSADALVNARTSNGGIRFTGKLPAGSHRLTTSNGGLVLRLPADSSFEVDASTSNGRIRTDFSVNGSERATKRHVHGTVGENPGATLELETSNGAIEIRRSDREGD